jgi:hypothetical protein
MNPLKPVSDITRLFTTPLKAIFVVGLCGLLNWMTYAGNWWVKWVALGMGIAVVVSVAREQPGASQMLRSLRVVNGEQP